MDRWYVVHTHAHCEIKAATHLRRQAYTVYLPQMLKKIRHARRVGLVRKPLFPRYLFVRMDVDQAAWRAIRSTIGVAGLVSTCDHPVPVPPGVIEQIKASEDAEGVVRLRSADHFRSGQLVEIMDGAFDGLQGLVEATSDEERVTLLLNLLGREIRVRVSPEMLRAVA
jgi:transcriptional antiterminator RfaH